MDKLVTPFLIGVAGGTGSGKTYIATELQKVDPTKILILSHDNYYKSHDDIPIEERKTLNYDEPAAIDQELFIQQLSALKRGEVVEIPLYDFMTHTRKTDTRHVEPLPIIIVEGILILADPRVCGLLDLTIFVDVEPDIRLARRLERDVGTRDRTFEESLNQYLTSAQPMHDKYVEPGKNEADLIINNNRGIEDLQDALKTVRARIEEVLGKCS
ncbi:MAG: uridine kinase [Patescibacteria group bacterium]|jgi:uridine kinase